MQQISKYFKSSYAELRKVVLPEKQDVIKTSIAVVLFIVILSAFMWVIDSLMAKLIFNVLLVLK